MTEPAKTNNASARAEYLQIKERTEALTAEAYERSANGTFSASFATALEQELGVLEVNLSNMRRTFISQEVERLLGPRFIGPEEIKMSARCSRSWRDCRATIKDTSGA